MNLKIYDPAMCCSTGVCGPDVEPHLLKLASDIAFLKSQGVKVERFNLGHQPEAFLQNPAVLNAMGPLAENLPLFLVEGEIRAQARYPSRAELAEWFGLRAEAAIDKPRVMLRMANEELP